MISNTLDIKYCPSCGKAQFKRVAEKLFVCKNCDFHYYHNPAAAAAVIIEYKNKIMLTVRNSTLVKVHTICQAVLPIIMNLVKKL